MKFLEERAEVAQRIADSFLDRVPIEERIQWFNSACTQHLLTLLQAEYAELLLKWSDGNWTLDNVDANTLRQLQLLTQVQELDHFVEKIYEMREEVEKDDNQNDSGRAQDTD